MRLPLGICAVNKPCGMSSAEAVRRLRMAIGLTAHVRKGRESFRVGHAGTLDPDARGVLVVGFGRAATSGLEAFLKGNKEYVVTAMLGVTTETLDAGSPPMTVDGSWRQLQRENVEAALLAHVGECMQKPPLFSALRLGGERMYNKMYRRPSPDVVVPDPPLRKQIVYGIKWRKWAPPFFSFHLACGSGYYVRALVRDVGIEVGCGATVVSLCRTQQGQFTIENAIPPEEWNPTGIAKAIAYTSSSSHHT